jgi:hypothetical protein
MNEKNIDIIFHKDKSSWEEFNQVLSSVPTEQAYDILNSFSKISFSDNSCIRGLKINLATSMSKSAENDDKIDRKTTLVITNFYYGGLKFLCKEEKGTDDDNNYYRILKCFKNLRDGKCKCPVMSEVIGKNALPELYTKIR